MSSNDLEPAAVAGFSRDCGLNPLDVDMAKRLRKWDARGNAGFLMFYRGYLPAGLGVSIFAPELIHARIKASCSSVNMPTGGIRLSVVTVRRV